MPNNQQAQKLNGEVSSKQSGDKIEEAIQRLKINDNKEDGKPDCSYYLKTGSCNYGSHCRYNHPVSVSNVRKDNNGAELPERAGEPDCEYFLKTGTCKYGSNCKYHHPKDRVAAPICFNSVGLPMRHNEKPCAHYMRTGSCMFGSSCKFHHPQPGGSILPLAPAVAPSSPVPYVGALPSWSYPGVSYIAAPHGLPIYASPSQGVLPVQGWSTYMGNVNPAASTHGTYGSNFVYDPAIYGVLSSVGQSQTNLVSVPILPERPSQQACRHFLSTGTCKYGSDCKFNHPKERIAHLLANQLSFPIRPGQAVCSHYKIYGYCKYGSTCEFEHPYMAHTFNSSLNQLSLPVNDTSLSSYPMNFPTFQRSESSLSNSSKVVTETTPKPHVARDN